MGTGNGKRSGYRHRSNFNQDKRGAVGRAVSYAVEALEQRTLLSITAPTGLLASPNSSPGAAASMLLAWQDQSDNETSFKVERSTDGTTFSQIDTVGADVAAYDDTTISAGTHYYYRVRAANSTENSSYSNASDAIEWTSAHVGSVYATGGSFGVSSGTTTIVTAGGGIGGWTSDDFRYGYRSLAGDGVIVAQVATQQNTNPLAKAGVMFRESTGNDAKFVSLSITPSGTAKWDYRTSNGAMATSASAGTGSAPYWVKLVREGSRFTGYISSNGTTWTQVAQTNIAMNAGLLVGVAQSSSDYGVTNTSTYTNVAVTATDHSLPSGWSDQDTGTASFAGSARFYGDTFTFAVESSGQNVGGTSDAFHFAHRTLVGDGEIVARVSDVQTGYALAKAGIMFRDGTGADAKNVFLAITAGSGAVWQSRSTVGGNTTETYSTGKSAPYYVKITRLGNTFTGYTSSDGTTWTAIGSAVTISGMSSSLEVGLALSAAGYGNLNTSTFDHVKLTPAVPVLSATLVHAGRIDLSWTDGSGSESGFILQRSEDDGSTWTTLGDGGEIDASGYADMTVDSSKTYKYRVKSFIDDDGAAARGESDWSAPPVSATTSGLGNGLAATFYDNLDFTGATATRTDQAINFLWVDGQAPISGIAASTFTAQWAGQILAPATGTYTFQALSDDGARVWVNNQLVLNDWDVHSPSTAAGTIDLVANNKYDIKVEYFQHYGAAQIGLSWVVPGASTGTNAVSIPTADLYSQSPNEAPDAPETPEGVYVSFPAAPDAATTPRVDVHWQAVDNADLYVVYRSDDGGATWSVAGNTEATATDPTSFRDADGLSTSASYRYRVQAIGAGGRSGLAEALDGPDSVTATQDGDVVTLTWVDNVAGEGGWRVDRSDDGGAWHPVTQTRANRTSVEDRTGILAGHSYAYRLLAVNNFTSSAAAVTSAFTASAFTTAADGLAPTFFAGPDFTGTSETSATRGELAFDPGDASPLSADPDPTDGYAARFVGRVTAPTTGTYVFHTLAEGGVRVWVNNVLVIDRWTDTPLQDADANEDGQVDFTDLVALAQNYNVTDGQRTRAEGDFTGDWNVDFNDLVKLAQDYNTAASAVPDDSAGIALTGGVAYAIRVDYQNLRGYSSLQTFWTTPGATEAVAIPASVLSADLPAPAAPSNVTAHVFSDTQIDLTWQDHSSDETGFVIEASTDAGTTWSVIGQTAANDTDFSATGLSPNLTYLFRVESVDDGGSKDGTDGDDVGAEEAVAEATAPWSAAAGTIAGASSSAATTAAQSTTKVEPMATAALVNVGTWQFDVHTGALLAGQPALPTFADGVSYRLTASSSREDATQPVIVEPADTLGGGGSSVPVYGDAEYSWTRDDHAGGDDHNDQHSGVDVGLKISGGVRGTPRTWGDYDTGHIYQMDVTGNGQALAAAYHDANLSDNFGVISVNVQQVLPAVSIEATVDTAYEEDLAPGEFTITRTGSTSSNLVVSYEVLGTSTATPDEDYVALTGTATILAGNQSVKIPVTPKHDDVDDEDTETVIVQLTSSVGSPYVLATDAGSTTKPRPTSGPATVNIIEPPANSVLNFLTSSDETVNAGVMALNVSNYETTVSLPNAAAFGATGDDPDNFRLQVEDAAAAGNSVQVKLQVIRAGTTRFENTYTLSTKQGTKFRSEFLRLVADSEDDKYPVNDPNRTIRVQLGDTIHITYVHGGQTDEQNVSVGRPMSEDNNGLNQLLHDIREVKVRFIVLTGANGQPVVTDDRVGFDLRSADEALAQATIRVNYLEQVNLNATQTPAILNNGYLSGAITDNAADGAPNDAERALAALTDNDPNTVDVIYVKNISGRGVGEIAATTWNVVHAQKKGEGANTKYFNFIVMSADKPGRLILPHELMHILLDSFHRKDESVKSLFFEEFKTQEKPVDSNKRIGPFPDAGDANDDTKIIRASAESLPGTV